jgi:peroxiredoxin
MKKFIIFKVLLSSLLVLTLFSLNSFAGDRTSLKAGDKASDFTINNFDGKTYTLSTSGGKATVVMFWSTECPFVQPYTERINALANEYTGKGIVFWGMNANNTEDAATVESHAKEKAYTFPMLKDEKSTVATTYGAQRTPEVYLIDNSTMEVLYHGRIDDNKDASAVTSQDLKNALDEFLAGKPISVKETKSFGCTIKNK